MHLLRILPHIVLFAALLLATGCPSTPIGEPTEDGGMQETSPATCITRPRETVELPSDKQCAHTQTNSSPPSEQGTGTPCETPPPRCQASDPNCKPLGSGAKYDETKSRTPLEDNPQTSINGCLNRGSCTHDGECLNNGCGNHCTSYQIPRFGSICPAYTVLTSAFCGCVKRRCTWFTQP